MRLTPESLVPTVSRTPTQRGSHAQRTRAGIDGERGGRMGATAARHDLAMEGGAAIRGAADRPPRPGRIAVVGLKHLATAAAPLVSLSLAACLMVGRAAARLYVDDARPDGTREKNSWTVTLELTSAGMFAVAAVMLRLGGLARLAGWPALAGVFCALVADLSETQKRHVHNRRCRDDGPLYWVAQRPPSAIVIRSVVSRIRKLMRLDALHRRSSNSWIDRLLSDRPFEIAGKAGELGCWDRLSTRFFIGTALGATLHEAVVRTLAKDHPAIRLLEAMKERSGERVGAFPRAVSKLGALAGLMCILPSLGAPTQESGPLGMRDIGSWLLNQVGPSDPVTDATGQSESRPSDVTTPSTVPTDPPPPPPPVATEPTLRFEDLCGSGPRPGQSDTTLPPGIAESFGDLYFTIEPQPGATGAGCPRTVEVCNATGDGDVYFQRTYYADRPGRLSGVALVPAAGSPVLFLGQPAEYVSSQLDAEVCVTGSERRPAGEGFVQLVFGDTGTVAFVRRQAGAYVELAPHEVDAWIAGMRTSEEWLWPVLEPDGSLTLRPDSLSEPSVGNLELGPVAVLELHGFAPLTFSGAGLSLTLDDLAALGLPRARS